MDDKIVKIHNVEVVAGALSSATRINILQLLTTTPCNVTEIAEKLGMPISSAISAVIKLEEAGLISTSLQGKKKICTVEYQNIVLQIRDNRQFRSELDDTVFYSIPVGDYCDFGAIPSCGLLGDRAFIGPLDSSEAFLSPNRVFAKLVWLRKGYLQYRIQKPKVEGKLIRSLSISLEICSEFPGYNNDFPSDISFSLNGKEIGVWTAPGDYGGRHGLFTPKWWGLSNTQFGDLVTCVVTRDGCFINSVKTSNVNIDDLELENNPFILFNVSTDSNGGFNLFGRGFGDYNQDIAVRIDLSDANTSNHAEEDTMPKLPQNYIEDFIRRNFGTK